MLGVTSQMRAKCDRFAYRSFHVLRKTLNFPVTEMYFHAFRQADLAKLFTKQWNKRET